MKILLKTIDSVPSKRIFHSIIADYQLQNSLCELIDNAIDNWFKSGKKNTLKVEVDLDYQQQCIIVKDNSGGVKEEDIKYIITPGFTKNDSDDQTIGFFGVGSKRAVVALASEIKISSRFGSGKTLQIEYNDDWIDDESWDMPVYQVTNIAVNTTKIELFKLREAISIEHEVALNENLGAIYALFLKPKEVELYINSKKINAILFDSWSYPPDFEPRQVNTNINDDKGKLIKLELLGGLTKAGDPAGNEYGVYLYCNNRLIARAYKGAEVGFERFKIGAPHPSSSLARVIVKIDGAPQLMPWNSSKSDINPKHLTFKKIQPSIEKLMLFYASVSKKFSTSGGWESNVFKYASGNIITEVQEDISAKFYLPPIPRQASVKYSDIIKKHNKNLAIEKPWVRGLYEAIIAVNEIPKLKLEQNNRISLLILDSTLEIAFKDYLVHESGNSYSEARLSTIMNNRSLVHSEIKGIISFKNGIWNKIEYFYRMRCDLIHKRSSANISDSDLNNFRITVEYALNKLFKINFK
jgi:histidine kinase/DNA gyrase B/HSP90-like ATPase